MGKKQKKRDSICKPKKLKREFANIRKYACFTGDDDIIDSIFSMPLFGRCELTNIYKKGNYKIVSPIVKSSKNIVLAEQKTVLVISSNYQASEENPQYEDQFVVKSKTCIEYFNLGIEALIRTPSSQFFAIVKNMPEDYGFFELNNDQLIFVTRDYSIPINEPEILSFAICPAIIEEKTLDFILKHFYGPVFTNDGFALSIQFF